MFGKGAWHDFNFLKFNEVCSMAQHVIYPRECSMCIWKECVFCSFQMECSININIRQPRANIIFNNEKLKAFPLRSGTRMFTIVTFIQHSCEILTMAIREEKEMKRDSNWKRRSKIVTVCRWRDTTHRKSQRCYQKTTRA